MAEYNYESLKQIAAANGGLGDQGAGTTTTTPQTFEISGTFTIDLGALQDEVLALKFEEETDQTFDLDVNVKNNDAVQLTGIDNNKNNVYTPTTGGSMFLNSDRVVINAKSDFAMLFGQKGVAIGSPEKVNIDSGNTITLFGHQNVFLGLPNKGEEYDKKSTINKPIPKSVGDGTPDELYEPMVLGLKLINLIEDLIVTIENAEIAGPTGNGVFQPSTLAEFELLKVRLPEILSSYAYLDGLTHEQIDEERLSVVKAAREKAKDFVPPRTLTGTFSGTASGVPGGGAAGPPANPVTSPYAELPGYFETPSADPYGDTNTL
jgi:hypothetical protein